MVVSKRFEPPDLVTATLRGVVTSRDQSDIVDWIRWSIRHAGDVRLMIRLETFGGWKTDASSATAWLNDDEGVSKMAIVGQPEWRLGVLTLLAQPIRRLPIAYFASEAAARRWLGPAVSASTHVASV